MPHMSNGGANYRLFWQEFRRTFHSTGAVLPSGPRLCRALARYVSGGGQSRRILEVGPGTGVVTHEIITQLGPRDTLDIVELNDRFVAALHDRLKHEAHWRRVADRVRIHHMPVEQHSPEQPYNAIVSGLPLNNFPADLVQSILTHLQRLAAPGGTLSFFEYIAVRRAKGLLASGEERERLAGITRILSDICRERQFKQECILLNVPPAWVHHLRFGGDL
jgi:phosphatidylethanolamine/phosphatidyl-N-methylethanolamine N-methyltransferase